MSNRVRLKEFNAKNIKEITKFIDKDVVKWIEPLREPVDELQIKKWVRVINETGKFYAKEAIDFILDYGFNQLNLKKIIGLTTNYNISSQKVMESKGFRLIKTIEKDYQEKGNGRWCDVLIYEINLKLSRT